MRYVSLHLPAGDGGRAFLVSEDASAYVIAVPVEVVDFPGFGACGTVLAQNLLSLIREIHTHLRSHSKK